jgi:hypothetical protein
LISYQWDGFLTDIAPTTENRQPLTKPYSYFDSEVTLHVAHPWVFTTTDGPSFKLIPEGAGPTTDGGQRHGWDQLVVMADPELIGTDCQTGRNPNDAEALAESIRSDPGLEATAPVAVPVGGAEALTMDVVIAAGASVCARRDEDSGYILPAVLTPVFDQDGVMNVVTSIATGVATGDLMRLYLFDVPDGSSTRILAIAIVAPESRFERAVEAAAPVVNSIEFHAP